VAIGPAAAFPCDTRMAKVAMSNIQFPRALSIVSANLNKD